MTERLRFRPLWIGACLGFLVTSAWAQPPPSATTMSGELDLALSDFDSAQQIQANEPDRARRLFRAAAQRLESIVATGLVNGKLEFNLGNCYLQSGDLGRAVLHYRRARRLIPRDALLADNLDIARSRCLTSIAPTRRSQVMRGLFFWHYDTSVLERSWVALSLYVLFWMLLVLRMFVRRRPVTMAILACGLLTVAAAGSIATDSWLDARAAPGVVTAMDVTVHKGPGTGYPRMFEQPLQPGVEFTLRERRGAWWKIELPDGKTGWIDQIQASLVTVDSADLLLPTS